LAAIAAAVAIAVGGPGSPSGVYSLEADFDQVEKVASRLALLYGSCSSLADLQHHVPMDLTLEQGIASKLQKRLQKAYEALEETDNAERVAQSAADAALLGELTNQAAALTPPVELVRLQAVDRGMY
jgi:hypothetical protein